MRICKKCGATAESIFCESCGTLTSPRIVRRTQSKKGDTFEATIWPGPSNTRGIRIGTRNGELYFSPLQRTIVLHLDGVRCMARLSDSFWNQCPEIRVRRTSRVGTSSPSRFRSTGFNRHKLLEGFAGSPTWWF